MIKKTIHLCRIKASESEFVNVISSSDEDAKYLALVETPMRSQIIATQFPQDSSLIMQKDSLLSSPSLFHFTKVASENQSTESLYEPIRREVVCQFVEGRNASVFVSGLRSSGKKRAFFGSEYTSGLIHRAADDLLTISQNNCLFVSVFKSDLKGEFLLDLLAKGAAIKKGTNGELASLKLTTVADTAEIVTQIFMNLRDMQEEEESIFAVRMSIENAETARKPINFVQIMLMTTGVSKNYVDALQSLQENSGLSDALFGDSPLEALAVVHCVPGLSKQVKDNLFVFLRIPALLDELPEPKSSKRPPKNSSQMSFGTTLTGSKIDKRRPNTKENEFTGQTSLTQRGVIREDDSEKRRRGNEKKRGFEEDYQQMKSDVRSPGYYASQLSTAENQRNRGSMHKSSSGVSNRLERLNSKIEEVASSVNMSRSVCPSPSQPVFKNYQSLQNTSGSSSNRRLPDANLPRRNSRSNSKSSKGSGGIGKAKTRPVSSSSDESEGFDERKTKKGRGFGNSPLDALYTGIAQSQEAKRDLVGNYETIILELKGALKDLIKTCEKQSKHLQEREAIIGNLHDQLDQTALSLERSNEGIEALKEAVNQKEEEMNELRERARGEIEKKEEKIKREKDNQAQLANEITSRDEEIRILSSKIQDQMTFLSEEKHLNNQKQMIMDHLKEQLAVALESAKISDRKLEEVLRDLEKEKDGHLRAIQKMTTIQHKLDKKKEQKQCLMEKAKLQFESQINQLQQEKKRMEEDVEKAKKAVKKEGKIRQSLEKDLESTRTAFEIFKKEDSIREKDKSEKSDALKEISKELEELKKTHDSVRREHEELKMVYKRTVEDFGKLDENFKTQVQKKRQLKTEKKSNFGEICSLRNQEAKMKEQIERLTTELKAKEKSVEELSGKLKESESLRAGEIQNLENRVERFVENIKGLNEKNGRLDEENQKLARLVENEKKEVSNYREKYKKMKEEAEKRSIEIANVICLEFFNLDGQMRKRMEDFELRTPPLREEARIRNQTPPRLQTECKKQALDDIQGMIQNFKAYSKRLV